MHVELLRALFVFSMFVLRFSVKLTNTQHGLFLHDCKSSASELLLVSNWLSPPPLLLPNLETTPSLRRATSASRRAGVWGAHASSAATWRLRGRWGWRGVGGGGVQRPLRWGGPALGPTQLPGERSAFAGQGNVCDKIKCWKCNVED